MNTEDQRDYLALRERQEASVALTCENNAVARAHLNLAALYRKRLAELDQLPA